MRFYKFFYLASITLFLSVLVGCQSMNAAVGGYFDLDTDLQIDFKVDADINPDELGKASPLFIRMYELSESKMMKRADFIEIYERDKEIIGSDLVAVHKLKRLIPGESRTEHFVLDKKTNYVALYAEFLEFKEAKYKLILPVVANNVFRNSVVIKISGNELIFDENMDTESGDNTDFEGKATKMNDTAGKAQKSSGAVKEFF